MKIKSVRFKEIKYSIVVVMLMVLMTYSVQAATLTVCPNGCIYSNIQAAVNASSNGDTIQVQSGTYHETVNINKQLIMRGIDNGGGKPVVDSRRTGNAITLSVDGITLAGFTATNASIGNFIPNAGIKVDSNNNIIIGNSATNNLQSAIQLYLSNNNTISGNIVIENEYGIGLSHSGFNNIIDNIASHNSQSGIEIYSSGNNTINGNTATNNVYKGIWLSDTINNYMTNNIVSNNMYGISLLTGYTTVTNNSINGNRYGIELYSGNNNIYNNYLNNRNNIDFGGNYSNKWNITKSSGSNTISGSYIGGNVWANPAGTGFSQTCVDTNSDGICDSPFAIDSYNIDYLPLAYKTAITPPITYPAESDVHIHKVNKLSLNNLSLNHDQLYDFKTLWTPNVWNVKNLIYVIFKISTPLNFTKVENYEVYQNGSKVSSSIPYTHSGNDYVWNLSLVDHIGSNIDLYTNEINHTNPWADLAINKTQEGNNTRLNITFIPSISLGYNHLRIRAEQILSYTYPVNVFSAVPGQHRIIFSSDTINQDQAYNFSVLVKNPEEVNLWLDNSFDWVEDQPSNDISLPVSGFGSINVSTNVPVKWSHRPVQPQYVQDITINMSASTPIPTSTPTAIPTSIVTPTPTTSPSPTTGGDIVSRYAGSDGIVQKSEAVQAVMDYFSGIITRQDAISVVMAYFNG